ncbi:hypothetical protein DSO57_1018950 [Entomophthora muscae]|uniref:Uncharacterized protein n=1 Tax=Entomophthora muscae TaxID=34485 RepID=A0ACC2U200_9FUNG|nr:hypothetical protein DSO57_1018950 [Entomophthora muscae]
MRILAKKDGMLIASYDQLVPTTSENDVSAKFRSQLLFCNHITSKLKEYQPTIKQNMILYLLLLASSITAQVRLECGTRSYERWMNSEFLKELCRNMQIPIDDYGCIFKSMDECSARKDFCDVTGSPIACNHLK